MAENEGKFKKTVYYFGTLVALTASLLIIISLVWYTSKKVERNMYSANEELAEVSPINQAFNQELENLKVGNKTLEKIIDTLKIMKGQSGNSDIDKMIIGFDAFGVLENMVTLDKKIEYEELRKIEKIANLMQAIRRTQDTGVDTTCFALLARDIIFYVFMHPETFLIHDKDTLFGWQDRRSLIAFYEDAEAVYYLITEKIQQETRNHKIKNDIKNIDLETVILYCKAVEATIGKNDKLKINPLITKLEKRTNMPVSRKTWFEQLHKDLKQVDGAIYRFAVSKNRPSFITTSWLN